MSWIERTRNGLRYVDRIKIDGQYKKLSTPIEKDTPQARRTAMERLLEKADRIEHPAQYRTVKELLDDYLARPGIRESTRKSNMIIYTALDSIISEPVSRIDAAAIRQAIVSTGKKIKTMNRYIRRTKNFLRWCYAMGYLEEDLSARLIKFPEAETVRDPSDLYLEIPELRCLIDGLSGMHRYAVQFLSLTGCRVGEMSALLMSDLEGDYINVFKSYSVTTKEVTIPKTPSSVRRIYIQPELREVLDEFLRWRKLYMMSKGIRTDLLFFSRNGNVLDECLLWNAMQKVGKKYHPHILRHTHTALLADQGMTLDAIARRLGHSDSNITKEVYYHVTEKQRKKDEQAMAEVRIL